MTDPYTPVADPYADLRRLAPEATPGPWRWWGHDGRTIALTTRGYGIAAVMAFARLGMQEAQPVFYKRSTKPEGGYIDGGKFRKAMDIAVRERDYRTDIAKLDHPDAEWIAAADPTTVSALIAERDALADILDAVRAVHGPVDTEAEFYCHDERGDAADEGCASFDECPGHMLPVTVCAECGHGHEDGYPMYRPWPCPTVELLRRIEGER